MQVHNLTHSVLQFRRKYLEDRPNDIYYGEYKLNEKEIFSFRSMLFPSKTAWEDAYSVLEFGTDAIDLPGSTKQDQFGVFLGKKIIVCNRNGYIVGFYRCTEKNRRESMKWCVFSDEYEKVKTWALAFNAANRHNTHELTATNIVSIAAQSVYPPSITKKEKLSTMDDSVKKLFDYADTDTYYLYFMAIFIAETARNSCLLAEVCDGLFFNNNKEVSVSRILEVGKEYNSGIAAGVPLLTKQNVAISLLHVFSRNCPDNITPDRIVFT